MNRLKWSQLTDVDWIHPESIQNLFECSIEEAVSACDSCVEKGFMERWVQFLNPIEDHARVLLAVREGDTLPEVLRDELAELEGLDQFEFSPSECKTRVIYKVKLS